MRMHKEIRCKRRGKTWKMRLSRCCKRIDISQRSHRLERPPFDNGLPERESTANRARRRARAISTHSSAIFNTNLPKFSPVNNFVKVSGKAATPPPTTSSRLTILPSFR